MKLDGKTAIVTGASRGLGASIAEALIARGAQVYGLARSTDDLEQVHTKLGERFHPVSIDITKRTEVEQWFTGTFNERITPDILINNAGIGIFAPIDELKPSEWDTMMDLNVTALYDLTRLAVPKMKQNPAHCYIINIASIAGRLGNPNLSGYNATKFAVRGFSDALMKELRYDDIKVSCLFPGSIATSFFDDKEEMKARGMMMPEDVANTVIHLLETPDNMLIDEIVMRPLNPKKGS